MFAATRCDRVERRVAVDEHDLHDYITRVVVRQFDERIFDHVSVGSPRDLNAGPHQNAALCTDRQALRRNWCRRNPRDFRSSAKTLRRNEHGVTARSTRSQRAIRL